MGDQGVLCTDELCGIGTGDLEGQRHGAITNYEERLAGLGDGEATVGEGHFCVQMMKYVNVTFCHSSAGFLIPSISSKTFYSSCNSRRAQQNRGPLSKLRLTTSLLRTAAIEISKRVISRNLSSYLDGFRKPVDLLDVAGHNIFKGQ